MKVLACGVAVALQLWQMLLAHILNVSTVLVLISTFMHAGWNLLARYRRSEAIFFNRMLTVVVRLVGTVMITFGLVLIGLCGG